MKIDFSSHVTKLSLSCLLLTSYVTPATAQFKLQQDFKGTTASGWTLSNSAILTAPSIGCGTAQDGFGLTDTGGTEKGRSLSNDAHPASQAMCPSRSSSTMCHGAGRAPTV